MLEPDLSEESDRPASLPASPSFGALHLCNPGGLEQTQSPTPAPARDSEASRSADVPSLQCVAYSFRTVGAAGASRELNYASPTAALVQTEG